MKKVRLSKDWMGHKAGTVLEVDAETFGEIEKAAAGSEYSEPATPAVDPATVKAAVKDAVDGLRQELKAEVKAIHVKDNSDNDPCWGYLGEHNKASKDLTKDEICFAAGKFFKDVWTAGSSGGREPEVLRKSAERARAMVAKAAGDGMLVGDDEHGGYAIFPAAAAMINRSNLEASIVRSRASTMTMSTQVLRIPYVKDETRASLIVYNGITVYWEDELSQMSSARPELGRVELKLHKLAALGYVSDEWVKWSPVSMGSWLIPKFGEAIAYMEDYNFINGTGAGKPLGLRKSAAKINISTENDQDADTVVLENTTKMRARLKFAGNEAWLMHPDVWPQLPLLNVTFGASGAPVFVNNAAAGLPQTLWGIPIIFTEKVPTLGDDDDIMLVAFQDYVVADDQASAEVASSIHFKFDFGQVAFRCMKWVDGQPFTSTAYTPPTVGSTAPSTLSPVIGLNHA